MLFALYDFLAYCLYSISRFSGGSVLLCAAFSEKPAVFVMQMTRPHTKKGLSTYSEK